MRVRIEANFTPTHEEPRFFVRQLDESDDGYALGYRVEIQLLDDYGLGSASVQLRVGEVATTGSIDVPLAVVEAAHAGLNDYVDSRGLVCPPSFLAPTKQNS